MAFPHNPYLNLSDFGNTYYPFYLRFTICSNAGIAGINMASRDALAGPREYVQVTVQLHQTGTGTAGFTTIAMTENGLIGGPDAQANIVNQAPGLLFSDLPSVKSLGIGVCVSGGKIQDVFNDIAPFYVAVRFTQFDYLDKGPPLASSPLFYPTFGMSLPVANKQVVSQTPIPAPYVLPQAFGGYNGFLDAFVPVISPGIPMIIPSNTPIGGGLQNEWPISFVFPNDDYAPPGFGYTKGGGGAAYILTYGGAVVYNSSSPPFLISVPPGYPFPPGFPIALGLEYVSDMFTAFSGLFTVFRVEPGVVLPADLQRGYFLESEYSRVLMPTGVLYQEVPMSGTGSDYSLYISSISSNAY